MVRLRGFSRNYCLPIDSSIGDNERMGIGLSVLVIKLDLLLRIEHVDYSYAINFLWSKLTLNKVGLVEMDIDYSKLNIANLSDPY